MYARTLTSFISLACIKGLKFAFQFSFNVKFLLKILQHGKLIFFQQIPIRNANIINFFFQIKTGSSSIDLLLLIVRSHLLQSIWESKIYTKKKKGSKIEKYFFSYSPMLDHVIIFQILGSRQQFFSFNVLTFTECSVI